ncbi:hypothetical protein Tdes44962_MAKER01727 [Teratosphaeria destructans]|uniref:Uncharacterized protein n=1 Tax=Teratosphaeria destructans TaxID=418781 RepID=A0A9W7W5C3_9PEZI|nr:hypothetical protein Tdes44962_MAKER01727 [Teratosphaeria destructans]
MQIEGLQEWRDWIAEDSLGVEDVVSLTVERWIDGMMDLRCKQRDGSLTADERNDLEDMEGQLRRQCYDCAAGKHHRFADKHFVPVSRAQDEQWKHHQRRKLLGDAAYVND